MQTRSSRIIQRMAVTFLMAAVYAAPAFAQGSYTGFTASRIKIGAFFPSSSDGGSGTWLKLGVDAALPGVRPFSGAVTRVGIDYETDFGSFAVPIYVVELWHPSASPIYFGLGPGLYTGRIKGGNTQSKLGARFVVGMDLHHNTFLELNYDVVGHFTNGRVDGLSIMLGKYF